MPRFLRRKSYLWSAFAAIAIIVILSGCEEQPIGYIAELEQRHHAFAAQTLVDVVTDLYNHTDEAVYFLERSALTNEYQSLFPAGWVRYVVPDSLTGQPYDLFVRNYLDQRFSYLRFDRDPNPNAVRQPSSMDFSFIEIYSYVNYVENSYYGDVNQSRKLLLEYADNRTNPEAVDGWMEIQRVVLSEETVNVPTNWQIRVKRYIIDTNNYASQLKIDANLIIWDKVNEIHTINASGFMNINRDGSGSGELRLNGDPSSKIILTNRAAKFEGYYYLAGDNYKQRYRI